MVKKILKYTGIFFGVIILLIVIASVAIIVIVDKDFVEDQMRNALNRHVVIEDIDVGIFSVVSGIDVNKVTISNYKTEKQLKNLEGKQVPKNDIFVSLESFRFKAKFLPLLQKKFILKELVLYSPKINISKSAGGVFNFSDLTKPKKLTKEEREQLVREEKEAAERAKKEPKKEFTAKELPIQLTIGKVGVENGTVNYYDGKFKQSFQVYGLTATVEDIDINPEDLKNHNSLNIRFNMGLKTVGTVRSGSVKSFDITFDIHGSAKAFNAKTAKIDPAVNLKVGSPNGHVTGLQVFDKITTNEQLNKYVGKYLRWLKGTQKWKGSRAAYVDVSYYRNVAKLSDGRINATEMIILFNGTTNIKSKALNVNLDLELSDKRKGEMEWEIRRQIESGIKKLGIGKYVKAEGITKDAMSPLLNDRGKVFMKFRVTGTTSNPKVKLIQPKLRSIEDVIKGAAGSAVEQAANELKKKAEKRARRAAEKAAKEASKKAGRAIRRLF